jgi:hypothetical protein
VLKAADGLPLARDPLVASALAALLLCFSRAPLDQQVLVTPPAMSLLGKLLQVGTNIPLSKQPCSNLLAVPLAADRASAGDQCCMQP